MTIPTNNSFVWKLTLCFLALLLGYSSALSASPNQRQFTLWTNNCLQCHASAGTTAPQIGISDDWVAIKAKGEEAILANIVHGIDGMPPLGYCSACTEEDFRQLLRMMTGLPDISNNQAGED
jgi:cytochrome c5